MFESSPDSTVAVASAPSPLTSTPVTWRSSGNEPAIDSRNIESMSVPICSPDAVIVSTRSCGTRFSAHR